VYYFGNILNNLKRANFLFLKKKRRGINGGVPVFHRERDRGRIIIFLHLDFLCSLLVHPASIIATDQLIEISV